MLITKNNDGSFDVNVNLMELLAIGSACDGLVVMGQGDDNHRHIVEVISLVRECHPEEIQQLEGVER